MRVNIYAEEMTNKVEIIKKEIDGQAFTGLRLYLELPCTLPSGENVSGPFIHKPGDDDSSAVTFWGKQDLRKVLQKAMKLLGEHYQKDEKPIATNGIVDSLADYADYVNLVADSLSPGKAQSLRCGVKLIHVLRRMLEGKDIHDAFGAPGDWGYTTPIGKALADFYVSHYG